MIRNSQDQSNIYTFLSNGIVIKVDIQGNKLWQLRTSAQWTKESQHVNFFTHQEPAPDEAIQMNYTMSQQSFIPGLYQLNLQTSSSSYVSFNMKPRSHGDTQVDPSIITI
jgi:hypothetical protein